MEDLEKQIESSINKTKYYITQNLLPIIIDTEEPLEGNLFTWHNTTDYTDAYLDKIKNISHLSMDPKIKNIMEIGFNSGFSTLLILMSNPNVKITCYDLGEHTYTLPCFNKLKATFGDRIQLIIGDSRDTLIKDNSKYDLIHIDGCHWEYIAESDIIQSYRLSKPGTILIMDDYNHDFEDGDLHELWDRYVELYKLQPVQKKLIPTPLHDVKQVPPETVVLSRPVLRSFSSAAPAKPVAQVARPVHIQVAKPVLAQVAPAKPVAPVPQKNIIKK